jgi:hypothetical protein
MDIGSCRGPSRNALAPRPSIVTTPLGKFYSKPVQAEDARTRFK